MAKYVFFLSFRTEQNTIVFTHRCSAGNNYLFIILWFKSMKPEGKKPIDLSLSLSLHDYMTGWPAVRRPAYAASVFDALIIL